MTLVPTMRVPKTTSCWPSRCLTWKSKLSFLLTLRRKGYISAHDLKEVFELLGETVNEEELQSKSLSPNPCSDGQNCEPEVWGPHNLQGLRRLLLQSRLKEKSVGSAPF